MFGNNKGLLHSNFYLVLIKYLCLNIVYLRVNISMFPLETATGGVLSKKITIFTGKHLCYSLFLKLFFNFIKQRLQHRCFPVKFTKCLRTPILKKICERLLLCLSIAQISVIYLNVEDGRT